MSRRGTLVPITLCVPDGRGFAFAVASRRRRSERARSRYATRLPSGALTMPSATDRSAAGKPSFAAAAASSSSRASAAANRSAVPPCSIDRLPDVTPSFGVREVSPEITTMRARSTSSSSATICASAVVMPCPSSTLPVNTVTAPATSIASHASSWRLVCRLPGRDGSAPCAATSKYGASEKATVTAAPRCRNFRRDGWTMGAFTPSPSPLFAPRARFGCACRIGTDCRQARCESGFPSAPECAQAAPVRSSSSRRCSSRIARPARQ